MIMRQISRFIKKKRKTVIRAAGVLFYVYVCIMTWEVFIGPYRSYSGIRRYNLYPFKTIINYFVNSSHYSSHTLFINLAANIVTFIPLGFFTPLRYKRFRNTAGMTIFSIIITTSIEALQFAFNVGVFDIDDIILNALGCVIGSVVYKVIKRILDKQAV